MATNSSVPLAQLLEQAKQQLSKPFANQQRKLLIYINVTYLFLAPFFLISEKIATGHYVTNALLGYVYIFVGTTNLISAFYNFFLLRGTATVRFWQRTYEIKVEDRIDYTARWLSILSIMLLSFLNMLGFGNPSSDSILVDFAFGHSLIVLAAVLLGRRAAFFWTATVIALLIFKALTVGYGYQYNYLTVDESIRYNKAINKQEHWALQRQELLEMQGLNPPTVSRYFNEWLVFILIAFFTAYFFMGISLKMLSIIPSVTENIANAIETVNQQDLEREREINLQEEQKMLLKQESLHAEINFLRSQINPHFLYNSLHYLYIKSLPYSEELADSILKLSDIMRYSLREDSAFVLVEEEITYLNDFIALHQLRNKNKLRIDFSVSGSIDKISIIPFILISLVENAFKHGELADANNPVTIKLHGESDSIQFYMKNKKSSKPLIDSTHIGLANIQRRLELSYPAAHAFRIEQDQESFTCFLTINTQPTIR